MGRVLFSENGDILGGQCFPESPLPLLRDLVRTTRAPLLTAIGSHRFLAAPWKAPATVFLFGAGDVAREAAELTFRAGFRTVVLDDRGKYAKREWFPTADEIRVIDSFEDCFRSLTVTEDSYVIIVTRGHRYEKTLVRQALRTRAGYIGLIGSIRKRDALFCELAAEDVSIDDLLRVYCPVGIDILAETPLEIAVSIVAQIVHTRARKALTERQRIHRLPLERVAREGQERANGMVPCISA
jgi:xanthine dehydrogenase accessory factor